MVSLFFLFFSFPFLAHGIQDGLFYLTLFPPLFSSSAAIFIFLSFPPGVITKIRPRVRFKDDPPLTVCPPFFITLQLFFLIHSIVSLRFTI